MMNVRGNVAGTKMPGAMDHRCGHLFVRPCPVLLLAGVPYLLRHIDPRAGRPLCAAWWKTA
jgi:hypothetical protein